MAATHTHTRWRQTLRGGSRRCTRRSRGLRKIEGRLGRMARKGGSSEGRGASLWVSFRSVLRPRAGARSWTLRRQLSFPQARGALKGSFRSQGLATNHGATACETAAPGNRPDGAHVLRSPSAAWGASRSTWPAEWMARRSEIRRPCMGQSRGARLLRCRP